MMPTEHYLRPEFTRMLADHLLLGSNINLSGAHGQGRRRTLKDLYHSLPDSVHIHQFDFRRDRSDPLSWLDENDYNSDQTLLVLHNFNELETDEKSQPFLDRLINLCNRQNISLLCITESEAQNSLKLQSFQLPPLSSPSA
ncbi:MAG TPA: hypothetical protein VKA23_04020 [Mariprofundaceae bacterium]|nr:hypothetical protein [Mariprofundaceae bacterium]